MLFLCPNDPDTDIRAISIKIICRLINYNSSYVVPYLKNILFELISSLNNQIINHNEKDKIQTLQILKVIIYYGKESITPHVDIITEVIIKLLENK